MSTDKSIENLRHRAKFNVTSEVVTDENGVSQQIDVVQIKQVPTIILLLSLAFIFAGFLTIKQAPMIYPGIVILIIGFLGIAFCIFVKWGGWIRVFPNKVEVRYGLKIGKYKSYPRYQSSTNLVYSYAQSSKNHTVTTNYYKLVLSSTTELGTTLAYQLTEDDGNYLTHQLYPIFKPSDDTPSDQLQDPMNAQADAWSSF